MVAWIVKDMQEHVLFVLNHTLGFKGFFNGEYHFSKSSFKVIKRMYLPLMGYSDINVEVGKFWGQAPFILLQIPIANQERHEDCNYTLKK
ncbi:hypothetical protein N9Y26_01045 [bacterium]|nr:hypothetical protein [bacterium]